MYTDESERSDSKFYYLEENIQSTSTSIFNSNTEENTSLVDIMSIIYSRQRLSEFLEKNKVIFRSGRSVY